MNCRWMFLEAGKTCGPVSIEALVSQIQQHKLGAFDLVCKEGENYWKFASDFSELGPGFASMDMDGDWVVLRNENGKYVQRGLFSTDELRNFLKEGLVGAEDFTWRSGMTQWCRIHELEIFKPSSTNDEFRQEINKHEASKDKFIESILLEPIVAIPRSDDIPEEADGVDLTYDPNV